MAGAAAGGEAGLGDAAIVRAVALLGRDLGMRVNAEGIETPERLDAVRGAEEEAEAEAPRLLRAAVR